MTPNRYARIKEVFLAVCGLPEPQRGAALAAACGEDAELRLEVEKLLAHHIADQAADALPGDAPLAAKDHPTRHLHAAKPPAKLKGPERTFVPGTIIADRYQIVVPLGRGGMGEVYRADDLRLRQVIAVKFLPKSLVGDPASLARLYDEVRLARAVTHPNVCRVFDIGEFEGDTFITMEFVDGETLRTLLKRIGRLPPDKAREIGRQICLGLAAAHEKGVLHRDLKPSNVLIDGRGQVRIVDFGLAGISGQIAANEIRAGTPAYMAPEQMAGREVSIRSDIYSLGLVLYELFTGQPAFTADGFAEMARLKDSSNPTLPSSLVPDIDVAVERTILRCLEKDPADRPDSATAVAAALYGDDLLAVALAAGQTPTPEMVAAAGETRLTRSAHAVAELAASLALIAVAIALSVFAHPLNSPPLPKAPLVLAEKARELLSQTQSLPAPADEAWGFRERLSPGFALLPDDVPSDGPQFATAGGGTTVFWYRCSPRQLTPTDALNLVFLNARIGPADPPPNGPGMATVIMDTDGRLLGLELLPSNDVLAARPATACDWSPFLIRAGFQSQELATGEAHLADGLLGGIGEVLAWTPHPTASGDAGVRIEAAELHGRPLFFAVIDETPPAQYKGLWDDAIRRIGFVRAARLTLLLVLLVPSLPLAIANLRRGRSDPRGAFRLGMIVFSLRMVTWLLWAHHVPELDTFGRSLLLALSGALAESTLVRILYLALEPFVRHVWPQTLISWTRILQGGFRSARVGRDLLLGVMIGGGAAVLVLLDVLIAGRLGEPLSSGLYRNQVLSALGGPGPAMALVTDTLAEAIYHGVSMLLLIVTLRALLKKPWAAELAAIVVLAVTIVPLGSNPYSAFLCLGAMTVLLVWGLTRCGLVSATVGVFVCLLLVRGPLTLDLRRWDANWAMLAVAVCAGLAAYAFYLARSGRARPAAV